VRNFRILSIEELHVYIQVIWYCYGNVIQEVRIVRASNLDGETWNACRYVVGDLRRTRKFGKLRRGWGE
jgi:hypothetical protein